MAAVACSNPTDPSGPASNTAGGSGGRRATCTVQLTWGSMHTGSRQVVGWCLALEGRGRPTAAQQQGARHVLPPQEAAVCAKKVVARGVGGGCRWLLSCISNGTAVAAQLQHWPAESSCLAARSQVWLVPFTGCMVLIGPPMQHCRQLEVACITRSEGRAAAWWCAALAVTQPAPLPPFGLQQQQQEVRGGARHCTWQSLVHGRPHITTVRQEAGNWAGLGRHVSRYRSLAGQPAHRPWQRAAQAAVLCTRPCTAVHAQHTTCIAPQGWLAYRALQVPGCVQPCGMACGMLHAAVGAEVVRICLALPVCCAAGLMA